MVGDVCEILTEILPFTTYILPPCLSLSLNSFSPQLSVLTTLLFPTPSSTERKGGFLTVVGKVDREKEKEHQEGMTLNRVLRLN